MCGTVEEQARSGGEQENSGSDGEPAADGIPWRSGDGENAEILQGEAGEGESEQDASAGEDAGHSSSGSSSIRFSELLALLQRRAAGAAAVRTQQTLGWMILRVGARYRNDVTRFGMGRYGGEVQFWMRAWPSTAYVAEVKQERTCRAWDDLACARTATIPGPQCA
jgi:hypothetical protein